MFRGDATPITAVGPGVVGWGKTNRKACGSIDSCFGFDRLLVSTRQMGSFWKQRATGRRSMDCRSGLQREQGEREKAERGADQLETGRGKECRGK